MCERMVLHRKGSCGRSDWLQRTQHAAATEARAIVACDQEGSAPWRYVPLLGPVVLAQVEWYVGSMLPLFFLF